MPENVYLFIFQDLLAVRNTLLPSISTFQAGYTTDNNRVSSNLIFILFLCFVLIYTALYYCFVFLNLGRL